MMRYRQLLFLLGVFISGVSSLAPCAEAAFPDGDPLVATAQGTLRGKRLDSGILRFAGIPYARPPLGDLRFKPPLPPQSWKGVREARDFGPVGIQVYDNFSGDYFLNQSEDCLSVNVWTPGVDNKRRPVIVFLHGGGFLLGGANHPTMHGTQFALRGDVVFVSLQYRLSVLGWLDLEGLGGADYKHSKNAGLLDQVMALRWVQKNIAAFGGDPGNVTLMGESAGSISATSMMLMPEVRKLFHKVIAESATFAANRTPARAHKVTREFLDETGAETIDDLLALNTDEIREAIDRLIRRLNLKEQVFFEPVLDGDLLPRDPWKYVAEGHTKGIKLLTGTNQFETQFWLLYHRKEMRLRSRRILGGLLVEALGVSPHDIAGMFGTVQAAYPSRTKSDIYMDMLTFELFRYPHIALSQVHGQHTDTWMYMFAWKPPRLHGIGAFHALELPFVFNNLGGWDHILGDNPPRHLAHDMQDAWISFARHGDPNHDSLEHWPKYEGDNRWTMIFKDRTRLQADPEKRLRSYWQELWKSRRHDQQSSVK